MVFIVGSEFGRRPAVDSVPAHATLRFPNVIDYIVADGDAVRDSTIAREARP
jgi:hypothetical protein